MRCLCLFALLLIAATGSAQNASSAVGAEDGRGITEVQLDGAARDLYNVGQLEFTRGRYDRAARYFLDAYEISERPAFLYNIALSHERAFQLEDSLTFYRRYLEVRPDASNRAAVEQRISLIEEHIENRASSNSSDTSSGENSSGENSSGENSSGENSSGEDNGSVALQTGDPETFPSNTEESGRSFVAPAIAYGVAGAGLVTFAVGAIIANGRYSDLEEECSPTCDPSRHSEVRTPSLVADIGLGVGIAGAILGTVLLLTGGEDDEGSDPGTVAFDAGTRPGGAEASLRVHF